METNSSSKKPIEAGVPPQLFTIYINNFPLLPHSNVFLFADDTLLYASIISYSSAVQNFQFQLNRIYLGLNEVFGGESQ